MPYRFEQAAVWSVVRDGPDFEHRAKERVEGLVRAVHATHAGRPVAEVEAELRRRFADHAITPQEPAFSEVVRAISAGDELP
ncbi:MAG TPA: hypothetical protein VJ851_02055 [Jatrophihabitans sp.]|nr:hypothetical protein [Jatrophihabitans sp.]